MSDEEDNDNKPFNSLLKEFISEDPLNGYFNEVGILLQDYISAKIMLLENANSKNPLYENFVTCLFFVVAERYKEGYDQIV